MSGLDAHLRDHLIESLARIDCALLLISHDIRIVTELCERTVVLHAGRVAEDGPSREVLAHPTTPAAARLVAAAQSAWL